MVLSHSMIPAHPVMGAGWTGVCELPRALLLLTSCLIYDIAGILSGSVLHLSFLSPLQRNCAVIGLDPKGMTWQWY